MTTTLSYDGRSNFQEFLLQVQKMIDAQPRVGIPKVNVYVMATSCGLKKFGVTKRKLERFAQEASLAGVTVVATKDLAAAAKLNEDPQLGLKLEITSANDLRVKWHQLLDPKRKLIASCGCSIFVSDGQGVDIKVLEPGTLLGIEL